ncbi:hypothetical protein Pst134EA_032070 [Puccinia striiformis f. sp. tritici]|uniref:uncharacterized protein n=1 Tax=Puccinia striiformis f. sp. tritici TaxID=168172 RepID=UPI002007F015|nr:uncharacterized protein Pst134EA_032070 [Puccinia striiformis f. sp. tritici]KAH9441939.1 hypothetical protein Pst134EA_032070 [Puccinia striiformis f. sp. tritici]
MPAPPEPKASIRTDPSLQFRHLSNHPVTVNVVDYSDAAGPIPIIRTGTRKQNCIVSDAPLAPNP